MPVPAAVVGASIGLQVAGGLLSSRAKKKARKKQRRLIRQALAQLDPAQIASLAAELGPDIQEMLGGVGATGAEAVGSTARAAGLNPSVAQSGLRNTLSNAGSQSAFETAMGLAPARANFYTAQAGGVQPNMQWANLANLGSQALNLYAGYKGLKGA